MTLIDAFHLFVHFIIFLGLGLLLYCQLLGLLLRFLFPKMHSRLQQIIHNHETTTP